MSTNMGRLQRVSGLRLSLLASLGWLPVACGGSTVNPQQDGRAGSGAAGGRPQEMSAAGGGAAGGRTQGTNIGGAGVGGAPVTEGGAPPISVGLTLNGSGIPTCESPTVSELTHLEVCANGYSHRPTAVACAMHPGPGDGQGGASNITAACTTDADCAGVAHGFCKDQPPFKVCASGCATDGDCESAELCFCDGYNPYGTCVEANCRTDADCGAGRCAAYTTSPCDTYAFTCQKAEDLCGGDFCASCASGFKAKACGNCGRPFLVNDEARVAKVEESGNWLASELDTPTLSGLSPSTRAALAAHWSRLGQMEHASIAAFARFNLQLLSVGAPAELIELCTRALADETHHTTLCFGLATHYAGAKLGPSRLDVSQSLNATSLLQIMSLVLEEGCIGETCAALEAAECAFVALDPALKRTYARIAQDEQRHADLAFRFLRWALAEATLDEREQFVREAERRVAELAHAEPEIGSSDTAARGELASHGVLDPRTLLALRRSSARDVAWPLLETLWSLPLRSHHEERKLSV